MNDYESGSSLRTKAVPPSSVGHVPCTALADSRCSASLGRVQMNRRPRQASVEGQGVVTATEPQRVQGRAAFLLP